MDITIAKRDLLRLVKRAAPVANGKTTNPILANVLLAATADGLRVSATDQYLSVSGSCAAEVRRQGAVAVDAKGLLERVGAMPDGPLLVSVKAATLTLKAAGSARRYTLHTIDAAEFPKLPQPDADAPRFTLAGPVLRSLVAHVVYCVSADDTRPNLNSALLEIRDGAIRLVATDGHRLAKVERKIDSADASLLVPLKALVELRKIAEATEGDVSVTASAPTAFFEADGSTFGVMLVEAQFPSYQKVIPQAHTKTLRLPRTAFADALKAVSLSANDKTGGIKLALTPGLLTITSENPVSGDGLDELPIDYQGEAVTVGFNAKYFLDVLGALGTDEVNLGLSGELDPCTIRPCSPAEGEDFVAVVMPMRI